MDNPVPDRAPETAHTFHSIGGPFHLIDHTGWFRAERGFQGSFMLVFFGYASCDRTWPMALGVIAHVINLLGDGGRLSRRAVMVSP
jgi:protein SCO1/2